MRSTAPTSDGSASEATPSRYVRFGLFEADLQTGELRKGGVRVKLRGQPFDVLALLLKHSGDVVTREELQQKLWPSDTYVDFDHGLNKAINKVRDALGDSADKPRFIETVPRKGYRFIFPLAAPAETPVLEVVAESAIKKERPTALIWAFVLLLAGLGWAIFYLTRHKPTATANFNIVPLTSYPGAELYPSFSPDGNEIAFAWNGGESGAAFDLYRKQIGSEKAVRLTNQPSRWIAPAWSPDGRFIAFTRVNAEGAAAYLVPALGGPERRLADLSAVASLWPTISWSPDSKTIALPGVPSSIKPSEFIPTQTLLLNVENGTSRFLPYPAADCGTAVAATFSPQGDRLAVSCPTNGTGSIYIQSADGSKARRIAPFERDFWGLAWAADGKSIIYSARNFLWRVSVSGGTSEKLLFGQNLETPAVALSGNRLAYSQQNGWHYNLTIWRLALNAQGKPQGAPMRIISSSEGQEAPRISPDGKRIVFESARSGNLEVWVADSDGSNLIQLTSFRGPVTGTPRWSPDSKKIVFDSRAGNRASIYVMNVEGGPARRLETGTADASQPSWSGDGRWIYFMSGAGTGIWKIPAAGGTAIRLTKTYGAGLPLESADGARVFYESEFRKLMSVSVNGGDERELMPVASDAWTPAKEGIYFLDDKTSQVALNLLDPNSGRVQKLADLPGRLAIWGTSPSLSADGRTLIFAVTDSISGDLTLVDGFR